MSHHYIKELVDPISPRYSARTEVAARDWGRSLFTESPRVLCSYQKDAAHRRQTAGHPVQISRL